MEIIKRIKTGLLLGTVLAIMLAGCGKSANVTPENEPVTNEEQTQEDTMSETEAGTIYDVIPEQFAYSLTVSINPLVELYFDAEDVVVGVAYLNDDAVDAYKDLDLVGSSFEDGMEKIVTAAADQGYLEENGAIDIELAQVGTLEKKIESSILTDASKVVNQTLAKRSDAAYKPTVEVKVTEEVKKATGVTTPTICTDCNGTGNNCKECGGTGDVRCKRCNEGIESCGTCGGTAVINCHGCKGSGVDGPNNETCSRCGGNGRQSCDACHGAGTFSCSWCHGALHHVCPDCEGNGSCPTCGGDGLL